MNDLKKSEMTIIDIYNVFILLGILVFAFIAIWKLSAFIATKNILREKVKSEQLRAIFRHRQPSVNIEYPMDDKYIYVTDLKSGLTSKRYEIEEYYGIVMCGVVANIDD